jgi:dihydroorotate dehydrogenase (fumarate)
MLELNIEFAGLNLKNPLIVSSGPCTHTPKILFNTSKTGVGAVITKSTFLKEDYDKFIAKSDETYPKCIPNYFSYFNLFKTLFVADTFSPYHAEFWAKEIKKYRSEIEIPIIASIIAYSPENYVKFAYLMQEAGVDALELNFSCPMPSFFDPSCFAGIGALIDQEKIKQILNSFEKEVSIPYGIKMSAELFISWKALFTILSFKPSFLTFSNLHHGHPGMDLDKLKPKAPFPATGISGSLAKNANLGLIGLLSRFFDFEKIQISASGGVMNYKDVVDYISFGSTTVQLNSVILQKGKKVIKQILNELKKFLEQKKIENIIKIRGIAYKDMFYTVEEYIRKNINLKDKIYVFINEEECIGIKCGICEDVCIYNAVNSKQNKKFVIDKSLCVSCGLCIEVCPHSAVSIKNFL